MTLPQPHAIATRTRSTRFYTRVIDGLRALPGVDTVGGTSFLPLAGVGRARRSGGPMRRNRRRTNGRWSMRGR